jgi:hypothetical protein
MNERDLGDFFKDRALRGSQPLIWLQYLGLALGGMVAISLAIFFFAVFAAFFVIGGLGVGIWFWWLRRKLRKAAAAGQPLEGEYVVIEKHTSIIEREDFSDNARDR